MCLTWTIFYLSQNSHVFDRLAEEVFAVIGPTQVPTYDLIFGGNMPYLKGVVSETLRLSPSVPWV